MTQPTSTLRSEAEAEYFRLLVENVHDYAIFITDTNRTVQSWNPGAERLFGYSADEIIGTTADILFTPEDIRNNMPAEEMRQSVEEGHGDDDRWHVRRDGSRFWSGGMMTPLWDENRKLRGFAKIMRDRTAWKLAQDRDRLKTQLLDVVGQAVIATDPDGTIVFWNRFAEILYGRTQAETVGRNIFEMVVPEEGAADGAEIMSRLAKGQSWTGEFTVRRADGTTFPVQVTDTPLMDDDGTVRAIVGVSSDISERKNFDDALRQSEARYRALMEQAPLSIQVFNPEGKTIRVNKAWEQLWGITLDQLGDYNILEDRQLQDRGVRHYIQRGFNGEVANIPVIEYDRNETLPDLLEEDVRRLLSAVIYPLKDIAGNVREVVLVHQDITARKRAEQELARTNQESEQQRRIYETALSNTADFNYVFDLEGRFIYVNNSLLALWQKNLSDAVGKNFFELDYPHDLAARLQGQIQQVIDTKQPVKDETPFTSAVGERYYEYIFMPVVGANGEVEAVAGSTRDVSERNAMEGELRVARTRLNDALSAGAVAIWTWDIPNDRLYADDKLADWFSVTPEQAAGSPLDLYLQSIHPDDRGPVYDTVMRALREDGKYEADYRIIKEGKPVRWVAARGKVDFDADRRPLRMTGAVVDISARKRAEEATRETERRYQAIGESIDYGIWVCDAEGRNTYASESFLRLVGLTQEQCSSFGWGDVLHPDDAARTMSAWKECVGAGGCWDIEHRFRGVDGRWHPILARGVPVKNQAGEITAWVGINLDISRLKQVEAELRDADRRKDEFLATLAHELRNPLAPIRNSLQILKMPRVDAQTVARSREIMERQVQQLVHLVDDLLDVSRVMRGKIDLRKESVELASIVARAVETVQPLIDAQEHTLTINMSPDSLLLYADPLRLTQVVANLLTNAAKYTERNGRIGLAALREGSQAVLRIRDSGIGLAPETLPHIFDLFVQVDHAASRSQGGLGIGLTLVKNLVEMHEGQVDVFSAGLGQGSEFVVRLPLANPRNETVAPDAHEPQTSAACTGHRLLVVDDNRDAADTLAMLLRLQGHDVRLAHDGPSALEIAKDFQPRVVFLDIGMPDMDGYEVARELRRQPGEANVVLVAITGWGQVEDRRRSAESGFDHHLTKPPDPKVVEALLADLARLAAK